MGSLERPFDSDGDEPTVQLNPIYESSNSYNDKQLPDIIGTSDFLVSICKSFLKVFRRA